MTLLFNCVPVRNKAVHCPFARLPHILGPVGTGSVLLVAVALIDDIAALTSDMPLVVQYVPNSNF